MTEALHWNPWKRLSIVTFNESVVAVGIPRRWGNYLLRSKMMSVTTHYPIHEIANHVYRVQSFCFFPHWWMWIRLGLQLFQSAKTDHCSPSSQDAALLWLHLLGHPQVQVRQKFGGWAAVELTSSSVSQVVTEITVFKSHLKTQKLFRVYT